MDEEKMEALVEYIEGLDQDKKILKYKDDMKKVVKYAQNLEIKTAEDKAAASNEIGFLKKLIKNMDQRRLDMLEPYRNAAGTLKKKIDFLTDEAKEARDILSGKLNDFLTQERIEAKRKEEEEKERIRQETEAKVEEALENAAETDTDATEEIEMITAQAGRQMSQVVKDSKNKGKARGEVFTTTQRIVTKVEVFDIEAFIAWVAKKPSTRSRFLQINKTEVNSWSKSEDVKRMIGDREEIKGNGIRVYKETTLVTR